LSSSSPVSDEWFHPQAASSFEAEAAAAKNTKNNTAAAAGPQWHLTSQVVASTPPQFFLRIIPFSQYTTLKNDKLRDQTHIYFATNDVQ
jgi:hypothetical protein